MESLSGSTPETNNNQQLQPNEQTDANVAEFHEDNVVPSTKIDQALWDDISSFVVGLDKTGTLQLGREFDINDVTAQAVFEELQDRGIITKHFVPAPGKGSAQFGTYDTSRFGGYMVMVNPDGSSKLLGSPPPASEQFRPHPGTNEHSPRDRGRLKRFIGRTAAGEQVVTDAENYASLWRHRAWSVEHIASGQRKLERTDSRSHDADRAYEAAVFGKDNSRWQRTVPPLEIVDDEPSIGHESPIEPLTESAKDFMRSPGHEPVSESRRTAAPEVAPQTSVAEGPAVKTDKKTSKPRTSEALEPKVTDPFMFAIEYVVAATWSEEDKDKPLPKMSEQSLISAFAKQGIGLRVAMHTYQELRGLKLIKKDGSVDAVRAASLKSAYDKGGAEDA